MRAVISGRSTAAEFEEECTSSITITADKLGAKSDMIFLSQTGTASITITADKPGVKSDMIFLSQTGTVFMMLKSAFRKCRLSSKN